MTVEFSQKQFALLKDILAEYRDTCYDSIFESRRSMEAADDKRIAAEYAAMAESEEARFNETKTLFEYLEWAEKS